MPSTTKITKIEGGYIIYTTAILHNAEQAAIKAELKAIAGGNIGHTFFRVQEARA
jgi:hypothetical protein